VLVATGQFFDIYETCLPKHKGLVDLLVVLDSLLDFELYDKKVYIFTRPETRGRSDEADAFRAMDNVREIIAGFGLKFDLLYRKNRIIDGVRIRL